MDGERGGLPARAPLRVCGSALILVAGVALVAPRNTWFAFDRPLVIGVALVGVLVVAAASHRASHRTASTSAGSRGTWAAVVLGALVVTALCGVLTAAARHHVGWDAQHVARSAVALGLEDSPWPEPRENYFARFPNNIALLRLETLVVGLGDRWGLDWGTALVGAQVLMVGVIALAVGVVAAVGGHPRRVLPVQGLVLLLLGSGPLTALPYSDIPAAACVAVAVAACACARRATGAGGVAWAVLAALALGLGLSLKPHVMALVLATLVVLAGVCVRTGRLTTWRRGLGLAGGVLVLAGVVGGTAAGVQHLAREATGMTAERLAPVHEPMPLTLWLAMGTADSGDPSPVREWGGFDLESVRAAQAAQDLGPERAGAVMWDRAVQQVRERGVGGSLWFHGNKIAWVWGDGTFWAFGEGADRTQLTPHEDGVLAVLAQWSVATGDRYEVRASLVQGVWVAVLLTAGVGLLRTRPDPLVVSWCLALILLSGYLAIFEARPRYLVSLVPVLLAITTRITWRASAPGS